MNLPNYLLRPYLALVSDKSVGNIMRAWQLLDKKGHGTETLRRSRRGIPQKHGRTGQQFIDSDNITSNRLSRISHESAYPPCLVTTVVWVENLTLYHRHCWETAQPRYLFGFAKTSLSFLIKPSFGVLDWVSSTSFKSLNCRLQVNPHLRDHVRTYHEGCPLQTSNLRVFEHWRWLPW